MAVDLTDRGLQRHRITFVCEMDEGELRRVRVNGPTIDKIEVSEFEGQRISDTDGKGAAARLPIP